MNLKQHHAKYVDGLQKTTLGILIKDGDNVCLAMKKRGFGAGKWNFSGGKKRPDETIKECHIRETGEEFGTSIYKLRLVAILYFYFDDVPAEKGWNQKCYVFMVEEWEGEPQESNEMLPKWWKRQAIPYHEMWIADRHWIEHVLDNKILTGRFLFTSKDECLEMEIILGKIIDE